MKSIELTSPPNFTLGVVAALAAGLLWGLVFVAPVLLPDYPPLMLTVARYLAFGLVTVPIAGWFLLKGDQQLKQLRSEDWWAAARLSLIGNFAYYLALSAAIQLAGAPLPTLIIGTLPVVIAVVSNLSNKRAAIAKESFSWRALTPSLIAILAGLVFVNSDQVQRLAGSDRNLTQYITGAALAWIAVAAWTWYPIKNAQWLKANPAFTSTTWATAQGIVTLPIAVIGMIGALTYYRITGDGRFAASILGPNPTTFLGLMFVIGLGASWLGTLFWNIASKNTPTALTGQLIVFETLAALAYAYIVYQRGPSNSELIGITMLVVGVVLGVRALSR